MWAVSPAPPRPCLLPLTPSVLAQLSTNTHPPRHRSNPPRNDADTTKDIKGLGHTILTALNSNKPNTTPNPIPQQQKQKQQKQKQQEDGKQMSGSDVLWALQRAAAHKNEMHKHKKKKNTKGVVSSVGGHREEEDGMDYYSEVRPLNIKSEWGVRLNELEKRLQELSETH